MKTEKRYSIPPFNEAEAEKARRKMKKLGLVKKGDGMEVDHKDGNPRNNKRSNLRIQSKKKNRSRKA